MNSKNSVYQFTPEITKDKYATFYCRERQNHGVSAFNLASKLIAKMRIPQLSQKLTFKNQLTIVMYHGIIRLPLEIHDWCFVEENSFKMQITYLKNHFEIISLSEAVKRMREGRIKRPTAVITFDDGYQNNFDVAFPILCRERMPATIFLNTGLVNTKHTVWYCLMNLALSKTCRSSIEWNSFRYDLSTLNLKAKASASILESLKEMPHSQLMATVRKIILELDGDPDCQVEIDSPYRMLSKNAIAEMCASELIEFGAHTHSHAILSRLSDEERYNEIRKSVDAVHQLTGRPCRYFAYPNGRLQDYNIETMKDLENCGIQIAVTTIRGPNNTMTPAMELKRYGVGATMSMAEFQVMVHHFSFEIRNLIGRLTENYKGKSVMQYNGRKTK